MRKPSLDVEPKPYFAMNTQDENEDSDDNTNHTFSQFSQASPEVQKKITELQNAGAKGHITWTKLSTAPCELAGKLTYKDMELTFDLHDLGMTMIEADGTVVYAMETRGENSVVATVEGETFIQKTNISNGTDALLMLHVGQHHDQFHKHDMASISDLLENAEAEHLDMSNEMFKKQETKLMNDKYDNAILEMFPALAAQSINAVSHTCMFNMYGLFKQVKAKSEVIDEETAEEMEKVTVRDVDPAGGGASLQQTNWWWSRRRQGKRCPYNRCGNRHFGRCGDGGGMACIWIICWNCDCNYGCEAHDDICHCHGSWGEHQCHPTLVPLLTGHARSMGKSVCGECSSSRATCR